MPIHDWTRVRSNQFHDFHQSWTIAIRNALNAGRLPDGYFAMVEQRAGGPEADVITLEVIPRDATAPDETEVYGGVAVAIEPPKARFVTSTDTAWFAQKANRVTVRHPDGSVVAVIEIVSPGNKDSRHAIDAFARKAVSLLQAGVNLLIVDLFPPGKRDPQGIHKVIWDRLREESFELPPDKPLTLAAYAVGSETIAYVEPVAVGDVLPNMPVFFAMERYVPCPLDAAYQTAWEQFPAPLKRALEASAAL